MVSDGCSFNINITSVNKAINYMVRSINRFLQYSLDYISFKFVVIPIILF